MIFGLHLVGAPVTFNVRPRAPSQRAQVPRCLLDRLCCAPCATQRTAITPWVAFRTARCHASSLGSSALGYIAFAAIRGAVAARRKGSDGIGQVRDLSSKLCYSCHLHYRNSCREAVSMRGCRSVRILAPVPFARSYACVGSPSRLRSGKLPNLVVRGLTTR